MARGPAADRVAGAARASGLSIGCVGALDHALGRGGQARSLEEVTRTWRCGILALRQVRPVHFRGL